MHRRREANTRKRPGGKRWRRGRWRIRRVGDGFRVARAVARRADMFAGAAAERWTTDIQYRSGRREGVLRILAERGQGFDATALALFAGLCEAAVAGHLVQVRWHGEVRRAVAVTPRRLAQAVLGRDDGTAYRRLGIVRSPDAPVGSLQRLRSVTLEQSSTWLGPDGRRADVVDGFGLVDFYRWARVGRREILLVGFSAPVLEALDAGATTLLPRALVRALPRHGQAGRLAAHVLSHAPLPGKMGVREIGTEALVTVVGPGKFRHPDAHPDEWRRLVARLAGDLDGLDPAHTWAYVRTGPEDKFGKVLCEDRARPGPKSS